MATGVIGFPSTGPGNDQGDMSPLFTREQAGHPDLNAPTNPYANRQDVRRMILERMGGRDPFSYDYIGQAQQSVYNNLPELFAYAFRGTNITYDQLLNGTISPRAKAHWNKVVSEFIRSEQAAAADQQRRDMQLYTKMAQEFEQDRRQYNADYWRANPTEAQIRQVQMGVLKEAERMTKEQLSRLPKDMQGNPIKMGPDGKPVPMTSAEFQALQTKAMENNIEQVAKYTGTMKYMPREMRDHFALKAEAKNTTMGIAKEWSDGKMTLKDLYQRLNEIPDSRMKSMIIENIKASGPEGAKLFEGMRQHEIMVKQGKENESPFGSITPKNLNRLDEMIEGQKPGILKGIYGAIRDMERGITGQKKAPEGGNYGPMGQTPVDIELPATGDKGPAFAAEPAQQKKGFWQSIQDILGSGGSALSEGFGPLSSADGGMTQEIARRGAGPETMNLLESGWNLAKSMFTPNEAHAAEFSPAMMMRESPGYNEGPVPIPNAAPSGGWMQDMQPMPAAYDPNPVFSSFTPAAGNMPADAPPFYRDASDILFGG